MKNIEKVLKAGDYAQRKLCRTCWDGAHYIHDDLKRKLSNCEHFLPDGKTECECECVNLMNEKRPRRKPIDRSLQENIESLVGEDVIVFGETEASSKHDDRG